MAESKPSSQLMEIIAQTQDEGLVPRIIISSNRHQMGKTNSMIRLCEKWQEEVNGRKWHVDDLALETIEFMKRRKQVPEWTPLQLDEPERPVGNKNFWSLEAQYFVEDLMTSPWKHIPALFALPHSHYLNNSIYGVATSLMVKDSKEHATFYELVRDQLNRNFKTYTPVLGECDFDPAYAWDWKDYMGKREAFDTQRGKFLEDQVAKIHEVVEGLSKDQVYQMVMANPDKYRDSKTKEVSASEIEQELNVSYAKANYASRKARKFFRDRDKAEKEV